MLMLFCHVSRFIDCYAECRHAECRYAVCRYAKCRDACYGAPYGAPSMGRLLFD